MPSPSSSPATLRADLGGSMLAFDLAASRLGFIGTRVAPVIESQVASGTFGKIPIEQLLKARSTARAPGGAYNRGNFTFTPANFATEEHGSEEPIDDREARMYADYFDAEVIAAERARDIVLRNYEQRVCDLVSNTSVWTGASLTTAVGTPWTTVASATPIDDVRNAMLAVWSASGLMANALIVSWKRFQVLKDCAQIIDRIKSSGFVNPQRKSITAQMIADALDLEEVIVAGGAKDTAAEGQTTVVASQWTDSKAMVCRVARTNDIKEPCIARTIHWGQDGSQIGAVMETYRDETVRSDIVRARMDTDELVMYAQAGHLLTSV